MSNKDYKIERYKGDDNNNNEYDLCFKIIIVGDSGVGKSCLAIKAVKGEFCQIYAPTIGLEYFDYKVKINDMIIKLQLWDTCGQEEYRSLITNYFRNSSLAVLVYAIDMEESFQNIEMWLNVIKANSSPDTKIVLIGNKADVEERKIEKKMGEKFCKEHKLCFFMETSAKTGFNANNLFDEAAKILYVEYKNLNEKKKDYQNIKLDNFMTPEDEWDADLNGRRNKKKCNC